MREGGVKRTQEEEGVREGSRIQGERRRSVRKTITECVNEYLFYNGCAVIIEVMTS